MALSNGQLALLLIQLRRYDEAFNHLLTAFSAFAELGRPEAAPAARDLRRLREAWGSKNFDRAWKARTGTDVPDWLLTNE